MAALEATSACKKTTRSDPWRRWSGALVLVAFLAALLSGCSKAQESWFTRVAEARRVASDLRVQFNKAADASNRSVMADTDDASIAYAAEAVQAREAIHRDAEALVPLLEALDYRAEMQHLEDFRRSFEEYEKMDRAILLLAVENTNLKAQKLAFGPERAAADDFAAAMGAFLRATSAKSSCKAAAVGFGAAAALREIQSLEAPHISEPDEAAMTRMERQMDELEASVRSALSELSSLADATTSRHLAAANAALERFNQIRGTIIALSRKNTNVRSLALSLGDKRKVVSACDSSLAALQDKLAHEKLSATR
ncbi:MAG: hypothetical protein HY898_22515 [Deltaproteobacteria bacterium]|nr:hypothetical protein [Deltaproteobacteria bacterium]